MSHDRSSSSLCSAVTVMKGRKENTRRSKVVLAGANSYLLTMKSCTIVFFCIMCIIASQICFVYDEHNLTSNKLRKKPEIVVLLTVSTLRM